MAEKQDLERGHIKIVREIVYRRDECDALKAELEAEGYLVHADEHRGAAPDGSDYWAAITAEKCVPLDESLIEPRPAADLKEKAKERKADRRSSLLWWILILVGLAIFLVLSSPTWRAIIAVIKSPAVK